MEERRSQLSISEMLSRAFNLCKDNVVEILKAIGVFMAPAIILIVVLVVTFIASVFMSMPYAYSYSYQYSYYDDVFPFLGLGIGLMLLIIVVGIISGLLSLFGSLVIVKILDDANKGNEVSWRSATAYVWRKKWSALGLNILAFLMYFIAIMGLILVSGLLIVLTLGIGVIIVFPLAIAIILIIAPIMSLFSASLIINDLGAIDAIRETFLLFRKGYFWSTIGRIATVSGISVGISIVSLLFGLIPFLGSIVVGVIQLAVSIYFMAYLNVLVLDRTKPQIDNFLGNSGDDDNQENGFIDPIN